MSSATAPRPASAARDDKPRHGFSRTRTLVAFALLTACRLDESGTEPREATVGGEAGGTSPVAGQGGKAGGSGGAGGRPGGTGGGTAGTGNASGAAAGRPGGTGGAAGAGGTAGATTGWPTFIAVGYGGRRSTSSDGMHWTDIQDEPATGPTPKALSDVAYGDGKLVAVGGSCADADSCIPRILYFDGAWKEAKIEGNGSIGGVLTSVAYGTAPRRWVAVSTRGPALYSDDGVNWKPAAGENASLSLRRVAYGQLPGKDVFIAVGDNSAHVYSEDGRTWSHGTEGPPSPDAQPVALLDVAIGNGVAVAVGEQNRRIRTSNGIDWTNPTDGQGTLHSIVFEPGTGSGTGTFYAFRDDGNLLKATDVARDWSQAQTVINAPRQAVARGTVGNQTVWVGLSQPNLRLFGSLPTGFENVNTPAQSDNPLLRVTFVPRQ